MLKKDFNKQSIDDSEIVKQIKAEFEDFSRKRKKYIKFGFVSILVIPFILMILMFSLESKIICLVLWVSAIIIISSVIIAIEYTDFKYKKLLGISQPPKEDDEDKDDIDNRDNEYSKKGDNI